MSYSITRDKTRKHDLERLDQARNDSNRPGSAEKRLDKVHKQTKDWKIASLRKELMKAHREGDLKKANQIERALEKRQRRLGL